MSSREKLALDLILKRELFFGKLIFTKDTRGNPFMKFSLGYKPETLNTHALTNREQINQGKAGGVLAQKTAKEGISVEVSYHFNDQKLVSKFEISGSIERSLFDVEIPTKGPLFVVRLGTTKHFKNSSPYERSLFLDEALSGEKFFIIFSIPGENGRAWSDSSISIGNPTNGIEITVPFWENQQKLCIVTAEDKTDNRDHFGLWIPDVHHPTKITGNASK